MVTMADEFDARVKAMEVDEKPTEQFNDVGGLETQIQELVEAIVLPMTHRERFDNLGIPRRVLSRSIEDTGTMIESLVPWHPTALFMVTTLGVAVEDYWRWQILTLSNLAIAPILAITGIGCAYKRERTSPDDQS